MLKMVGKISDVIPQGEFEYSADCHNATYNDINGNVYTGISLWRLMGWVDDRIPMAQTASMILLQLQVTKSLSRQETGTPKNSQASR